MTNKEALIATLQVNVPDQSIDLALINAGIDGTGIYGMAMQEQIEKTTIDLLYGLFTTPDISEGGYSISHPDFLRKVKERLLYLANKYGLDDIIGLVDPKPTVKGASPW